MAQTQTIPVADLLCDTANPRLPQTNEGQRETFRSLAAEQGTKLTVLARDLSSGPHHQDSGEAKIRESTAGVSRKPSSDGKACGCSSKHLCGLTAWNI